MRITYHCKPSDTPLLEWCVKHTGRNMWLGEAFGRNKNKMVKLTSVVGRTVNFDEIAQTHLRK